MNDSTVYIIGAGPAGLSAALELVRNGVHPVIIEASNEVGGIARTEVFNDYLFDIGGHRFFTKNERIHHLWNEMLRDDFLSIKRLSRIYYRDRYFSYPLRLTNTLGNLGVLESVRILLSRIFAALCRKKDESNFEQWVSNRFGKRMYRLFFKSYTEKVWGMPCSEIHSAWASQRIKGLSLVTAVIHSIFRSSKAKSFIEKFHYPRLGSGLMWRRIAEFVEDRGGRIVLGAKVVRLHCENRHVRDIVYCKNGEEIVEPAGAVLSGAPVTDLIDMIGSDTPKFVRTARLRLKHRAFVMVFLVVDKADLFPDQWIYVHSPDVDVCRIQNFKNWSVAMVPDPTKSSLGMEYFCDEGGPLWSMSDKELIDTASRELERIKIADRTEVIGGCVVRQPKAYPIYHHGYEADLESVREYLCEFDNLWTIGRNGTHRYNNMDHSMQTGHLAARAILGEHVDTWGVNDEAEYLEESR